MERLKSMVAPDQFTTLKVAKSSLELLTFDAEADSKTSLTKFLIKLDGKGIKLSGFADPLRVRAARKKVPFPKRHDWNSHFRESKETNENNPGERPDTVYISHLPTKWFVENDKDTKPSELVLTAVFSTFGEIREVDIPSNDIYRDRIIMLGEVKNEQGENVEENGEAPKNNIFKTFSRGSNIHFECFIQYADYSGFAKCMKQLRGKKLLYMLEDEKGATASIEVDFDKIQHLSEKNIRRRNRRRERLIRIDAEEEEKQRKEQEERARKDEIEQLESRRRELLELKEVQDALEQKEQRRQVREDKRKNKREEKRTLLKRQKEREQKITAMTEAMTKQRKDEAVALVTELLKRIAKRKQEEEIAEARRQAELLLRKQIEEKKRKLEEQKLKEKQIKKKKVLDLDDEEKELKKRLKKIMMEKKERGKQKKREEKLKKIKESKKSLRSAVSNR